MEIEDVIEKLIGEIDFESDVWYDEKNTSRIDDYAKVIRFAITKMQECSKMEGDPCISVNNCGKKAQDKLVETIFNCISIETYKQLKEKIEKYAENHSNLKRPSGETEPPKNALESTHLFPLYYLHRLFHGVCRSRPVPAGP